VPPPAYSCGCRGKQPESSQSAEAKPTCRARPCLRTHRRLFPQDGHGLDVFSKLAQDRKPRHDHERREGEHARPQNLHASSREIGGCTFGVKCEIGFVVSDASLNHHRCDACLGYLEFHVTCLIWRTRHQNGLGRLYTDSVDEFSQCTPCVPVTRSLFIKHIYRNVDSTLHSIKSCIS